MRRGRSSHIGQLPYTAIGWRTLLRLCRRSLGPTIASTMSPASGLRALRRL